MDVYIIIIIIVIISSSSSSSSSTKLLLISLLLSLLGAECRGSRESSPFARVPVSRKRALGQGLSQENASPSLLFLLLLVCVHYVFACFPSPSLLVGPGQELDLNSRGEVARHKGDPETQPAEDLGRENLGRGIGQVTRPRIVVGTTICRIIGQGGELQAAGSGKQGKGEGKREARTLKNPAGGNPARSLAANLHTKTLDVRGFDSSRI